MAGLNKVVIIGNLGRDPEIKNTQSGTTVGRLNVAISERKKAGDEWVEHTEWVRVSCFGRTAENVGQYLSKGSKVCVEGRMSTTKYTDQSGVEKWSTEVVAHNVLFLDNASASGQGGERNNGGGGGGNRGGGGNSGALNGGNRGGNPNGNGNREQSGFGQNSGGGGGGQGGGQGDGFYDDDLPF